MNGLYPIIRRVRRPLVPVEGAAGGADAKPAVPVVQQATETSSAQPQRENEQHGESTSSEASG